jgi:hypothetical protein
VANLSFPIILEVTRNAPSHPLHHNTLASPFSPNLSPQQPLMILIELLFRFVSSFAFACFLFFLHILSFLCRLLTFSLHTPSYLTSLLVYGSTHFLSLSFSSLSF